MLYEISREFHFCYGHRLARHSGKCRNLHGHNAKVIVTIPFDRLTSDGMAIDFDDLKKIGGWIDSRLDHKMLLWEGDPLLASLKDEVIVVTPWHPTAENIAQLILEAAKSLDFKSVSVEFWETEKCFVKVSDK